jgi:hypothetical protein
MDLREIGFDDRRWMELAQDRVQWRALVLAVFSLWAQLGELIVSSECRNECGVVPSSDISYVFIDRRCIEVIWREAVSCSSGRLHYQQPNGFCHHHLV